MPAGRIVYSDSNSNCIMTKPGSICKVDQPDKLATGTRMNSGPEAATQLFFGHVWKPVD